MPSADPQELAKGFYPVHQLTSYPTTVCLSEAGGDMRSFTGSRAHRTNMTEAAATEVAPGSQIPQGNLERAINTCMCDRLHYKEELDLGNSSLM